MNLRKARRAVRCYYPEWCSSHYHGPCGPIACVLQEAIGGQLNYCMTAHLPNAEEWYGHYVVILGGQVFDIAGVFAEGGRHAYYRDIKPEPRIHSCWTEADIDFWRVRLQGALKSH